jgi:hypothetical protein
VVAGASALLAPDRIGGTLVPMDWIVWFNERAGRHPRCDEYVGLSVTEVTQRVGAEHLRILDTNDVQVSGRIFVTSDLRLDRVNVLVQDGVVTAAAKF